MAAMGYVQLHGGSVSPAAALQAVRDMRAEGAGAASLQARRRLPFFDYFVMYHITCVCLACEPPAKK